MSKSQRLLWKCSVPPLPPSVASSTIFSLKLNNISTLHVVFCPSVSIAVIPINVFVRNNKVTCTTWDHSSLPWILFAPLPCVYCLALIVLSVVWWSRDKPTIPSGCSLLKTAAYSYSEKVATEACRRRTSFNKTGSNSHGAFKVISETWLEPRSGLARQRSQFKIGKESNILWKTHSG